MRYVVRFRELNKKNMNGIIVGYYAPITILDIETLKVERKQVLDFLSFYNVHLSEVGGFSLCGNSLVRIFSTDIDLIGGYVCCDSYIERNGLKVIKLLKDENSLSMIDSKGGELCNVTIEDRFYGEKLSIFWLEHLGSSLYRLILGMRAVMHGQINVLVATVSIIIENERMIGVEWFNSDMADTSRSISRHLPNPLRAKLLLRSQ